MSDVHDDADSDVDDDVDGPEPANRDEGGTAKVVLDYLARSIVDEEDAVHVDASERGNRVNLSLHVAPGDMGKVIGRRGRVVQAIRSVVRAAASRDGMDADVDVVE